MIKSGSGTAVSVWFFVSFKNCRKISLKSWTYVKNSLAQEFWVQLSNHEKVSLWNCIFKLLKNALANLDINYLTLRWQWHCEFFAQVNIPENLRPLVSRISRHCPFKSDFGAKFALFLKESSRIFSKRNWEETKKWFLRIILKKWFITG